MQYNTLIPYEANIVLHWYTITENEKKFHHKPFSF